MAITATALLEEGTATNWTGSFTTTATATPTGDREILVVVTYQVFSGSVTSGTLTGQGITWAKVADGIVGTNRRMVVFRGSAASPSNGALTFTLDTSATGLRRTTHEIELSADADINNIVQAVTAGDDAGGTSGGVTLSAFANASNACILFGWKERWEEHSMAVDSPLSIVGSSVVANTENSRSIVGLYAGEDTTPSFSYTTAADWIAIGLEVAAAAGGTDATALPGAIGLTVTTPTPAATGSGQASPGVVAATSAMPAPSASGAGTASPGVVSPVLAVPQATAAGDAVASPATIATVIDVLAPQATGAGNATPGVITLVVATPTATAAGSATAGPGSIGMTVTLPTPAGAGTALATPGVIEITLSVPTPSGGELVVVITARVVGQFWRNEGRLHAIPLGTGLRWGMRGTGEAASDPFVYNQGTISDVMDQMDAEWAAHSGADAAVLKAAVNARLNALGYRGVDGEMLPT